MVTSKQLLTAEDVWNMDDDGCRHELIRGELLSMPPTNDEHSRLLFQMNGLLWDYQRNHPEIYWFTGDPGFLLAREPDLLLGPDIAAIHSSRLPEGFPRGTFFEIIPDLTVEILSPSERVGQINTKVNAYLDAGVRLIWLVDPVRRNVTIHAPQQHTQILEGDDILDGGDVLPEFRLPLGELFG
jgi:Uma2 family endonuclease